MTFVIGNHRDFARDIFIRLGISPFYGSYILDYRPGKNDRVLMMSSGGIFHGDSGLLTYKLKRAGVPIDTKVIIDRHGDFLPRTEIPGDEPIGELLAAFGYGPSPRKEHPKLYSCVREYASHAYSTYDEGTLRTLAIIGVMPEQKDVVDAVMSTPRRRLRIFENRTEVVCIDNTHSLADAVQGFRGRNMHLSVDIDVLHALSCVEPQYMVPEQQAGGYTLDELAYAVGTLGENNNIAAFDICGLCPRSRSMLRPDDWEGINVYRRIVNEVIMERKPV